jgi:protein-S-isoprenylcysteine O-methyltransferase Ste14
LIIDYKNGFFYDLFFEFGKKINDKNFDCQFKNILLSNVVKFFYLPIMLDAADVLSTQLGKILLEGEFQNDWYNFLYALLYLIDVSIAVIGYTHASRPMNAHVRSVNPYPFGWVFALVCYAPFNIMIFQRDQFKPFSTPEWTNFIPLNSVFGIIYGAVVLILTAIYVWGTLSFDVRFSNLTNRGIIRSGPYRFMKHPSYWAKNISWWLIFLPFLAGESFSEKILLCLPCLVLNLVYVLRAYTEELHLAEDPDYRSYVEMLKSKRKLCR